MEGQAIVMPLSFLPGQKGFSNESKEQEDHIALGNLWYVIVSNALYTSENIGGWKENTPWRRFTFPMSGALSTALF